jgi:hypothetical protein
MSLSEECKTWFRIFLQIDDALTNSQLTSDMYDDDNGSFQISIREILASYPGLTYPATADVDPEFVQPGSAVEELDFKTSLMIISSLCEGHPQQDDIQEMCDTLFFKRFDGYREFFESLLAEN